jgi:uncharacterized membrane protein
VEAFSEGGGGGGGGGVALIIRGAVTFRLLGVPRRRNAESAEFESGCRIWLP